MKKKITIEVIDKYLVISLIFLIPAIVFHSYILLSISGVFILHSLADIIGQGIGKGITKGLKS